MPQAPSTEEAFDRYEKLASTTETIVSDSLSHGSTGWHEHRPTSSCATLKSSKDSLPRLATVSDSSSRNHPLDIDYFTCVRMKTKGKEPIWKWVQSRSLALTAGLRGPDLGQ